jgi:hypothetical protein
MITIESLERIRGWFTGRLPQEWLARPPEVTVDRDEITVVLGVTQADQAGDVSAAERQEARAGRVKAFREETREARMRIAREAEHRYQRKVSWGVRVDDEVELFTHLAAPVMTRLRQSQRQVLDTLVDAGVARSRSEALAWCVRLVGQHEEEWLAELRDAMSHVAAVRTKGPAA